MTSMPTIGSMAASFHVLPVSAWTSSPSRRSLSRNQSRQARRWMARPSGPRFSQAGCACRNAPATAWTSAAVLLGTDPTKRPSAGQWMWSIGASPRSGWVVLVAVVVIGWSPARHRRRQEGGSEERPQHTADDVVVGGEVEAADHDQLDVGEPAGDLPEVEVGVELAPGGGLGQDRLPHLQVQVDDGVGGSEDLVGQLEVLGAHEDPDARIFPAGLHQE